MKHRVEEYEKLGAFYLGREYDTAARRVLDDLVLYDAKDLTTHAVCVGMTGSGKTGLCITLLEEAAIDGIPSLVVDMKGDLANLLLAFPDLAPDDFRPWVDPAEALRKGKTVDEYAADRAALWKKGLADWEQDGERIRRFRDSVEFALYTPGSHAGRPLSVLKSFKAPPREVLEDLDAMRARVGGAVSGLLGLLGINADPVRSRESILLSSILDHAWRDGRDLDLGGLIQHIQTPPFTKVGFFDLDTFFPAGDRLALAMAVNNLVAAPGFSAWMEGEPLDVGRLLWTASGRPRMSILSIAHLSDAERMFFLTSLLNEVGSWMRTQSGTSSLRALLYIDEVFGYLPPTANPPSKIPLLTLLKQARAFGLGVVLATQNPVDLDYKALSNAGTWLLGRLQTERDVARVIDGLEGAAAHTGATFNRARIEQLLSGLSSRVFLMNNVHEDEPVVLHSRWALSYLRGPVTRDQLKLLADGLTREPDARQSAPATTAAPTAPPAELRPTAPAGVEEAFLAPESGALARGELLYRPALVATATLHYTRASAGVDDWQDVVVLAPLGEGSASTPWEEVLTTSELAVENEPVDGARFEELPSAATRAKSYDSWKKRLAAELYRANPYTLWKCKSPKAASKPGETEGEFRVRLRDQQRESRDLEIEKLRDQYASKLETMKGRVQRAEERVEREESQYEQQRTSTIVSLGATLLSAFFGRKLTSRGNIGRAASTVKGASRASREKDDIARAEETLEETQRSLRELEAEFEDSVAELQRTLDDAEVELEALSIPPRKSDLDVRNVRLVWTPWVITRSGRAEPAFTLK